MITLAQYTVNSDIVENYIQQHIQDHMQYTYEVFDACVLSYGTPSTS